MDSELFEKDEGKWDVLSEGAEGDYLMFEDAPLDMEAISGTPALPLTTPLFTTDNFTPFFITRSTSMPVISEDNIPGTVSSFDSIPKPQSTPNLPCQETTDDSAKVHVKKSVSFQDFTVLKEEPDDIEFEVQQGILKEENPTDMEMFETRDFLNEVFSQQNEDPSVGLQRQFKSCPDFSVVHKAGVSNCLDSSLKEVSKKMMASAQKEKDGTVHLSKKPSLVPIMPALPNVQPFFTVGSNPGRMARSMTVPSGLHLLSSDSPLSASQPFLATGKEVVRESRRHRRLARSREYAKNRREQKKTIKQQLELDAVQLQNALQCIRTHKTGQATYQSLIDLLRVGMRASAQPVTKNESIFYVSLVLQHQMKFLEDMEKDIKDILVIPWMLGLLKGYQRNSSKGYTALLADQGVGLDQLLAKSFQETVKFEQSQINAIQEIVQYLKKDLLRIKALRKLYKWLQRQDWVNTPNSDWAWSALDAVFNEQQTKKLQRWCESNKESIQRLDLMAKELINRSPEEKQALFGFGIC